VNYVGELAKLVKYRLYPIGLLRTSCPPPYGPAELFKITPGDFVSKNLASHFDRSPFHLRLAVLPGWLIQGCSSVSNPFTGEKIHRIFPFVRLTHSYGYASAGDRPNCFASFSLNSDPFMQYVG